jgi:cytochrome c oxidase cbb3-type subunit 3
MRNGVRILVPACLVAGVLAALTMSAAAARTMAERLENGQKIFLSSCAMCHGADGMGDGPLATDLDKQAGVSPARLNDAAKLQALGREGVKRIIIEGGGHGNLSNLMPAWGQKLSPVMAEDVTDFVMSLPSRTPQTPSATLEKFVKAPPGSPEAGKKVFVYYCSGCHGLSGKGDGVYAKTLRARHKVWPRNLTQTSYFAKKTDKELYVAVALGGGHIGKSTMMPAWTVTLTPTQIKDVVSYVRAISKTKSQP